MSASRDAAYPCPCCGFLSFGEPPGSYEICPFCFWEDDELQLEFATTLAGGANKPTLQRAQQHFATCGACEPEMVAHVRRSGPSDARDPAWRPIDSKQDRFEDWSAPDRRRPPARGDALYYWRPGFWRRRQ